MKQLVYILLLLVLIQACSQEKKSMKEQAMPVELHEVASEAEQSLDTVTLYNANSSKSKSVPSSNVDKAAVKGGGQELKQPVADEVAKTNLPKEEFDVKVTKDVEFIEEKSLKKSLSGKVSGMQVASSNRKKDRGEEGYKTQKMVLTPAINEVFVESGMQKLQQLFDIAVLLDDENTTQEMKDYALSNSFRYYLKPKGKMSEYLLKLNKIKADSIVLSTMKLKRLVPLETLNSYKGIYKVQVNYYQGQKLLKESEKTTTLLLEIVPLNVDGQIYTTIESKVLEIK